MDATFMVVIGDVHGQFDKLVAILQKANLIDKERNWSAGEETLWFLGDYFDRGPDGVGVIELVMDLQKQARAAGGRVGALIGNHDVLILAAFRFGEMPSGGPGGTFLSSWQLNGGNPTDLERLEKRHLDWLESLPAMVRVGNRLFAHADATFYQVYGRSVPAVNQSFRTVLKGRNAKEWDILLDYFSQRRAFQDGEMGQARVARFLGVYGGRQFVHGHTPVCKLTGQPPESTIAPLIYAGGLAIDADPGMYLGGPGFVVNLPVLSISQEAQS
jgi:hypothetical protein